MTSLIAPAPANLPTLAQTRRHAEPAPPGKTVLLVADAPWLRELLCLHLRAAGCFPMAVASVGEGRRLAAQVVPDLIVLDVDGLAKADVAWALQQVHGDTGLPVPAVLLGDGGPATAAGDKPAPAAALRVRKPLEPQALMRQLLPLLRPGQGLPPRRRTRAPLRAGRIELDRQRPVMRLQGAEGWHEVDLPWTEHRLLACLLAHANRACSRQDILRDVWPAGPVDPRTVDQYVRRLRQSLSRAGVPGLVKTVNGLGYRLDLAALPPAAD
ncbi:MAG: response regulator transcription factor [Rubrivivax sp.]|nr:response regulator transcription factor [Rubrivivax sp.]